MDLETGKKLIAARMYGDSNLEKFNHLKNFPEQNKMEWVLTNPLILFLMERHFIYCVILK